MDAVFDRDHDIRMAHNASIAGLAQPESRTTRAPSTTPLPPGRIIKALRAHWLTVLFIGPAIVLVVLVSIYPVFDAIALSLYATKYAEKVRFVGLQNYGELLRDPTIWKAGANSLVYTLGSLFVAIPFSLAVALLLNRPSRVQGVLRTIAILPWVISQTITALLWGWLLNADFGPVTYGIDGIFGVRTAILASPIWAMVALVGINIWSSYPQATLLMLAALQTIPRELYEAAHIDGAGRATSFRYITLPLMRSTLLVVVIQLTLLYFNMVTLVYVFTGGGPLASTETLALRVLKTSFENWNLGQGAALGLIITLINLAFSLLYIRTLRSPKA
jgi:multiple sugar transport system permease protein